MAAIGSEIGDVLPDGTPIRSEEIGFAASELLTCPKCSRPNSPERQNCIYCGESIGATTPDQLLSSLENTLESWELGFNLVLRIDDEFDVGSSGRLGELLGANVDLLKDSKNRGTVLPIGRYASIELAKAALESFGDNRVKLGTVTDRELNATQPPVRLRGIKFDEEHLILHEFNTDGRVTVAANDLRLIVEGNLFETKTEETQKKRRKNNPEIEVLKIESDRPVIDIYTKDNDRGFRSSIHGFDFSCLGSDKQLLAATNLSQLSKKLQAFSSECRLDNNYRLLRPMLDPIWELETAKDHKGMLRVGLERKGRTTVEIRTNDMQFTKYSRLQALSI